MFSKKKKHIVIVGCGRMGANIVDMLSEERENIVVIDKDKDSFLDLPSNFSGFTIEGDGTDIDILNEGGIGQADILLALTENDNANLMIAQLAKKLYRVPKVVARVYDIKKDIISVELGIDIISPIKLFREEFKKII